MDTPQFLSKNYPPRAIAIAAAAIVLVTALILLAMGQASWYKDGIKFWHANPNSSENSQHLFDPYSFTHIIHGIGFYLLLWIIVRGLPLGNRFLMAVGIESSWEIFENTPMVIERYRTATLALNYYGDSVINSIGDIIVCMLGFYLASKSSVWVTILCAIAIEIILIILIQDSLILNIIMLIHPIGAIKGWQMG